MPSNLAKRFRIVGCLRDGGQVKMRFIRAFLPHCGKAAGHTKRTPKWRPFWSELVGAVNAHSNKSVLLPPTPGEVAKLARQSREMGSWTIPVESQEMPIRSLRRRLSPQEIEELVARYNAGEDTPALSRAYGISRGGLRKLLLAQGVSFRKQPMTFEDAARAAQLYERGLTIKQVVVQVGYSFSTIRRMLHASGVDVRERGGGKRAAAE